jgi:Flp pilus assembly protein TadG
VGKVFARDDAGQTVVLVALMFTVLMGFAALGIDVGRFYSERRYIQGAVDSAALACAYKYAQGGVVADAWAAGDAVLQNRTLKNNPLGIDTPYAARGSEVYDPFVDDHNLISGILPVTTNGRGCRVAITVAVPTFLIKIVSPALNTITMTTSAYAKSKTGMLPTVVNRYANPPGPGNGNPNQFIDHLMAGPCSGCPGTAGFDYQCTTASSAACTPASEANPGREFVIFGQAAKATNDSSFRGYIALDIRDFTNVDGLGNLIHDAYNYVPATASINVLKDYESSWVLESGYPGPDICVVDPGSFLPCAQLAVINGSSSGQFVDDYTTRFDVGDKLLLQMYDGTVKTVPDFNLTSGTNSAQLDDPVHDVAAVRGQLGAGHDHAHPGQRHHDHRWWRIRSGEPVPQRVRDIRHLRRESDAGRLDHLHAELDEHLDVGLRPRHLPGMAPWNG